MDKKAIISVSSTQSEKEDAPIEVVTPGKFYEKSGCFYAVYNETEISGMEGTTTTLKIYPDKFVLIRTGTTTTRMEFQKGSKNVSLYNTPYGTLELGIDTKELDIEMNDCGGKVIVKYGVSVGGHKNQTTILNIDVKA
ncbi:MAG: DUF1934 domain-containing protein [Bacillota bacterium]|nr:DUF1934 domain-containing protein [Bacillota bacterium]